MAPVPDSDHRVIDRLPPDLVDRIADDIRRTAGAAAVVRVGDPHDRRDALLQDQQREMGEAYEGPPFTLVPVAGSQARGAIVGTLVFGAVGLVLGLVIGLIPMFGLSIAPRLGLWALVGAMAGAAAGFVFGGGREPELEGAIRDTSGDVTIAVESDDEDVLRHAVDLIAEAEVEVARRARRLAREDRPTGQA